MLHTGTLQHERLLCKFESLMSFPPSAEMARGEYNVLFLCTGNSARSLIAECALNRWGKGRFRGFSAGSRPKGVVHPLTLELLRDCGYETGKLRSKSWDEFATPESPRIDFVFTVCDQAAAEQCPVWPGHPATAHWSVPDPAAFIGTKDEQRRCFARTYLELENRVTAFVNLDIERLDLSMLQKRLDEIGGIAHSKEREE